MPKWFANPDCRVVHHMNRILTWWSQRDFCLEENFWLIRHDAHSYKFYSNLRITLVPLSRLSVHKVLLFVAPINEMLQTTLFEVQVLMVALAVGARRAIFFRDIVLVSRTMRTIIDKNHPWVHSNQTKPNQTHLYFWDGEQHHEKRLHQGFVGV